MTPITPMLETPTGRLAELVHLLSDTPLSEAVSAVSDTTSHVVEEDDPWWIVASALVKIKHRKEETARIYELRIPA